MFRVYVIDWGSVYYLTGWVDTPDGDRIPIMSMDDTDAIRYKRFDDAHADMKALTGCDAHIDSKG